VIDDKDSSKPDKKAESKRKNIAAGRVKKK
jgi:hypothetical protein